MTLVKVGKEDFIQGEGIFQCRREFGLNSEEGMDKGEFIAREQVGGQ